MIRYYAKAMNARGKIEQMLVTKEQGKPTVPQWTGKIYKSDREADADLTALNCAIARETRSFERMMASE
jgi:hypothetical protein